MGRHVAGLGRVGGIPVGEGAYERHRLRLLGRQLEEFALHGLAVHGEGLRMRGDPGCVPARLGGLDEGRGKLVAEDHRERGLVRRLGLGLHRRLDGLLALGRRSRNGLRRARASANDERDDEDEGDDKRPARRREAFGTEAPDRRRSGPRKRGRAREGAVRTWGAILPAHAGAARLKAPPRAFARLVAVGIERRHQSSSSGRSGSRTGASDPSAAPSGTGTR